MSDDERSRLAYAIQGIMADELWADPDFDVNGTGPASFKIAGLLRSELANARNAALEAKALTEAEEATATRYATEIIELRAELAKTAAVSSIHVDRAEAAEVELESRTRELDEERVSTRTQSEEARRKAIDEAADVADRLSREWASDAELWHKDGMLKTAAASVLHSEAAGKIAAAIRALKAEGESR